MPNLPAPRTVEEVILWHHVMYGTLRGMQGMTADAEFHKACRDVLRAAHPLQPKSET